MPSVSVGTISCTKIQLTNSKYQVQILDFKPIDYHKVCEASYYSACRTFNESAVSFSRTSPQKCHTPRMIKVILLW